MHYCMTDANMFYFLEAWVSSVSEPNTTAYLSQIQGFQRHITTAAFKIAGGVDLSGALSASRPLKQYPVEAAFQSKIVKSFLDALYAMLDGLVHLASKDSPIARGKRPARADAGTVSGTNRLELLDLTSEVGKTTPSTDLASSDHWCRTFARFL
jgi:exocyst complex component 2